MPGKNVPDNVLFITLVARANEQQKSLMDVSRDAGVPYEDITAWRKGKSPISEDALEKLCSAMGTTVDEMMRYASSKSQSVGTKPNTTKAVAMDMGSKKRGTAAQTQKKNEHEDPVKEDKVEDNTEDKTEQECKQDVGLQSTGPETDTVKTHTEPEKSRESKAHGTSSKQPSRVRSKTSTVYGEKLDTFTRNVMKLKKSVPITERDVKTAVNENMQVLTGIFSEMVTQIFNHPASEPDPKLKELIEAAEKASDEGIELAITILKKWKKTTPK